MVRVRIVLAAIIVAAFLAPAITAGAAPANQCKPGSITQYDMVGTYESGVHQMKAVVFPCGGIYLEWSNDYGTQAMSYVTVQHLPDGVVARLVTPDPYGGLDSQFVVGLKAAERGWIQVFTPTDDGGSRVYRLRKVSNLT
jgi:hypothetical protein